MRNSSISPGRAIALIALIIALIIVAIVFFSWLGSFMGVDAGHVAIVKEGGPFDGRALSSVRQPGSGLASIGIYNHQYNLPTTQRDLTDEAGRIVVPTADGVNVVVDGQALFQLKVDGNPDMKRNIDARFFRNFGLRKWDGKNLWDDDGWVNYLNLRLVPILYQSVRQTIGTYECTQLNNTCVYLLNADAILASTGTGSAKPGQPTPEQQAKQQDTSQNLAKAEQGITDAFKSNLIAGLGDEYFENIRFQNLRVTFETELQHRILAAQSKRAQVAEARLEAQRVQAAAKGQADRAIEAAKGERRSNHERAQGIRDLAKAYRINPAQAKIELIKALCGVTGQGDPKGCGNLQVLGGSGSIINQLK